MELLTVGEFAHTTSVSAPTRYGPPGYFSDAVTPGRKFVLGDLPPGTTREQLRAYELLMQIKSVSIACHAYFIIRQVLTCEFMSCYA
jgi:hypothetical protein